MASIGIRVICGVFNVTERIAPALGGRLAFELFCRTRNPGRIPERERKALEAAGALMNEARREILLPHRGQPVVAAHFQPTGPTVGRRTVLVIHGWNSRSDHMAPVISALREQGFAVVAIDLPGHGRSPGRRLNMANAVGAAAAATSKFGAFEAVVGHSFGGAVAVNAIAGSVRGVEPVKADRLVLIAAPSSMAAIFDGFSKAIGLGTKVDTNLRRQVERVTGRALENFDGGRQIADLKLPVLVLHAPDDREVPASEAQAYAGAGAHVRLKWMPGLGHRRILADPQALGEIGRFVSGRRAAIPAGSEIARVPANVRDMSTAK